MAQLMDYARYLAKEIGPRPAGTEEEQQAALYITEQFQKEAGFTSNIEEFAVTSNVPASNALLAGVIIVVSLLAMILPVLSIPAFILAVAAAAIYVLEALEKPVISRLFSHGASQNVIAKYQPNQEADDSGRTRPRSRKIVLVAHYDSGRVTPSLVEKANASKLPMSLICLCGVCAAALFSLLRIFISAAGGGVLVVLNVLTAIALIICLLPVLKFVLTRSAQFNMGANNNATGTAALIEVARRISRGSVSEADLMEEADDVVIHGEQAAREAGLIPEGVQVVYEAEPVVTPPTLVEHDEEDRLLAAKAAIAALTGKPVERRIYGSVADNLVNSRASAGGAFADSYASDDFSDYAPEGADYGDYGDYDEQLYAPQDEPATAAPAASSTSESVSVQGFENAPSWFVAAQKNAKKSDSAETPVQRSRYTEALERGERDRNAAMQSAAEQASQPAIPARVPAAEAYAADSGVNAPAVADAQQAWSEEPWDEVEPEAFVEPIDSAESVQPADEPARFVDVPADFAGADDFEIPQRNSSIESPAQAGGEDSASASRQAIDLPDPSLPEGRHAGRHLADNLPSIDAFDSPAAAPDPSRSDKLRHIRTNVPSLSGVIRTQNEMRQNVATSLPSVVNVPTPLDAEPQAGQHAPASANSQAAPAMRDVVSFDDVDYDMEVDFNDDFASEPVDAPIEVSASVDDSLEIPKTRMGGFISRLRGKGKGDAQESTKEWLDIEGDFDARSVGRARGGWESFRDENFDDYDTSENWGAGKSSSGGSGTADAPRSGRSWQGGAYSRMQLGHVNMRSGADAEADTAIPNEVVEDEVDRSITGEIEQIYHFRNPSFNTEIWFVAIGADDESHTGARAFLEGHRDELRGSMVIEVESLGGGALSVASQEGTLRKVTASSRIKRYTRDAIATTGITLDEVSLAGSDSIASIVQKAGFQSMHLFGAENGRIAAKGSADDVLENIDELQFDDNVNFVFELLKSQ